MVLEDFGIDQNLVELDGNNSNIGVDNEKSSSPIREQGEPSSFPPRDDSVRSSESSKDVEDNSNSNANKEDDVLAIKAKEDDNGKSVRFSLVDVVKRGETNLWYIRCKYNPCKWSVRAEGLSGSTYFIIKKYVADHTCAASSMNNGGRTASAKTIGSLIMHRGKGLAGLIAKASKAYRVIDFQKRFQAIDRRINKGKTFLVQPVDEYRFLVRGDTIDCLVDLDRRTCSCGKYDLLKIPCRHAIKAGLTVGRAPSSLTDEMYTTSTWRTAYEETINPIDEQEGEESADTRRSKTNFVHRKELKKRRGADAVDVANRIITANRVHEKEKQPKT
ncbi:unnamed protein product [Brassica rapa]|uniref:SWIM-type domain-containing protein n=1 Tax=Brassica campestris TaxID=3711 RepID=A0A8D9GWR1_BRACM|nr:unnamed protein product [Brassica rapa]